jgi:hypothetical protein
MSETCLDLQVIQDPAGQRYGNHHVEIWQEFYKIKWIIQHNWQELEIWMIVDASVKIHWKIIPDMAKQPSLD